MKTRRTPVRRAALLGLVATLAATGFLLRSRVVAGPGFPLDDAWIHQTIARNLALRGEWAFLAGHPASGSTSPLWTLMISIGHRLGTDPVAWADALGVGLLVLVALAAWSWMETRRGAAALAGLLPALLVLEWHLVWAAVSGMEILLLALVAVLVLRALDSDPLRPGRIGLLIGAAIWIRPEAVLLMGAGMWRIGLDSSRTVRQRLGALMRSAGAAAIPFAAYLVFHAAVTGAAWPSTFFAKAAEYAVETRAPLLSRLAEQAIPPLVGGGAVLLPGVVLLVLEAARAGAWHRMAPLVWVFLHWSAYAIRLPVVYQHGRYGMPTIPVLFVLGVEGAAAWLESRPLSPPRRLIGRAWVASALAVSGVFWWLGAGAYAVDVAIIESEMVAASRWIAGHTEPGAQVAAHDIGALGYFGDRAILDLAGLASPEVIPFLRDEGRLAEYLDERGADYLMTFPGWYPELTARAEPIFATGAPHSPAAGGENMVVYRWRSGAFSPPRTAVLYSSAGEPARRASGNDRHPDRR
ncbi:MAG: hypothetical protein ACRDHY_00685 [Anaerolineales bacterium]